MSIIEKILGLDILCNYLGDVVNTGPEYECVPLITLQSRNGSLVPAYTIRKYWDKEFNLPTYQNEPWNGPIDPAPESIIPIMIPFPQRISGGPRTLISASKTTLTPITPKINYLDVKNVKEIAKFDFSRLGSILEYTRANGILTTTLYDMVSVCELLSGFYNNVVEKFEYCVMRYNSPGKVNAATHASLMFHITFLDLGMCTPIFDSDKVDGVGVMCEYIYKFNDERVHNYLPTGRGMYMILSNKSENIITVDGTIIGEHSPPSNDLIRSLMKVAVATQQQPISMPIPNNNGMLSGDALVINTNPIGTTAYGSGGHTSSTSFSYYTTTTA